MEKRRVLLMMNTEEGYARQVLRGVVAYARPKDAWTFHRVRQWPQAMALVRKWRPHGIIGHFDYEPVYKAVCSLDTPIVEVMLHPSDAAVPHVLVDDVAVGRLAAEHFLQRRRRHFGFVGYSGWEFSHHRRKGYEHALQQHRYGSEVYLHHWPDPERTLDQSWSASEARLANWLKHLPTGAAVFVADDNAALEVSETCLRLGLEVPEQIAILGVDNDDLFCRISQPPLSSVQLPFERIGYEAAALLDRLLRGGRRPRRPRVLQPLGIATRPSTDVLTVDDSVVSEALLYISENIARPILVQDVLDAVVVSRSLLEKRFRACLGRTPLAEITRQRIEHVRQLLAESDLPIAKIGRLCGFRSTSRLSAIFRAQTGQTPSDYRKSLHAGRRT